MSLKFVIALIAILAVGLMTGSAEAANASNNSGKPKLSTSMRFNGSHVKGQYQVPAEATALIENEKPLEELLGLRTQFRDRMKQDTERQ